MKSHDHSAKAIKCPNCGALFWRNKSTGRKPVYCSPGCKSAFFRKKGGPPPSVGYDQEIERIAQSAAGRARALAQVSALPVPALPLEAVRHCVALQRDLDDCIAVAIRNALDRGADWEGIAALTSMSVSTLKSRYSNSKVTATIRNRHRRRPPAPRTVSRPSQQTDDGSSGAAKDDDRSSSRSALARALSHLHRRSGMTVRTIGLVAGTSPSYVYRIMAGQRIPSWPVVRAFAQACDTEPGDFAELWHAAHGHAPAPAASRREAAARFQGAVRGLHLAEACPPLSSLTRQLDTLSRQDLQVITSLLGAQPTADAGHLGWQATAALTVALHGRTDRIRPLWQAMQNTAARRSTMLAEAFG
ncbi:helix-turn-helix domain-containing protein [Streptomyces sp. NPDC086796]|uniref:helix-turn-helix domain-containing protein n=1 Tax=unclassified Streptomyces TaxID=2593676 RepID=UPI003830EBF5